MQSLITFGLFAFLMACHTKAKEVNDKREKYQVISPIQLDTFYIREYVAEIQSVENVELRARVRGFIEKIHVDEGKPVKAGQVLFTISNKEFQEELLKANAQLKSAQAELIMAEVEGKNTKTLVDKNIVSKSELDLSKAKIEAIEAKIDEAKSAISVARINISFTEVRAPFSGVINRIPNKAGSLVDEGTLLTSISNNKEVFAYFNLSEKEYLEFLGKKNMSGPLTVTLLLADNRLFGYKGHVETTESEIDKTTGNIAFRARFPNPELLLKHGATAKILLTETLTGVLAIPQKSTFDIQDKIYVYALDKDNRISMRSIVPKLRLPQLYIIESGVDSSDRIIYEGIQQVSEGDVINPEMLSMKSILTKLSIPKDSSSERNKHI
ncbi:MAG: efflux RND transporter periplasmic adaptor subunit [Chitinophagales bacterium]